MSSSDRGLRFWASAWLPVAVGVALIALESTSFMGSDHTSGPIRWIFEHIFGPVSDARWARVHFIIRKSGHFTGYGLIGLAWLRAWWMTLPRAGFIQSGLLALAGTALVASADEFHQSFLPNRTASVEDMLLDCIGAMTLEFAVYVFVRLRAPGRLARAA